MQRYCNFCKIFIEGQHTHSKKPCNKCKRILEIDQYRKNQKNLDKHENICKDCRNGRPIEQGEKKEIEVPLLPSLKTVLTREQRLANNQLLNSYGYRWVPRPSSTGHPYTLLTPEKKEITEEEALSKISLSQKVPSSFSPFIHTPKSSEVIHVDSMHPVPFAPSAKIGQDVYFVLKNHQVRAAKIVNVSSPTLVNLLVFFDGINDRNSHDGICKDIHWIKDVQYSEKKEPGTWHFVV